MDLTLLSGTTLSTVVQDAIIDQADRKIKTRIKLAGLSPPASDDDLKTASIELSYAWVIRWNQSNGIQTKSVKVGDITIQDDPDAAIALLSDSAFMSIDAYIAIKTSGNVAIPISRVVGRSGIRVGEYEEMTEDVEEAY